jgi:hypothetical protein
MTDRTDFNKQGNVPQYDRGITPAESAARAEREGERFRQTPADSPDSEANADRIHTTDGYTTDREGLLNNYAIEPEMYINEPGDLREREEAAASERARELEELKTDEEGKLTDERDTRHKGQGLI